MGCRPGNAHRAALVRSGAQGNGRGGLAEEQKGIEIEFIVGLQLILALNPHFVLVLLGRVRCVNFA